MNEFFRTVAAVLLAVILVLILKSSGKGIGELLSILVCCMVLASAIAFIRPVMEFIQTLENIGGTNTQMLKILLKVVGISATGEIACLICEDAGNTAMGKALQFLSTAVILYLSLPLLTAFLRLIEEILNRL